MKNINNFNLLSRDKRWHSIQYRNFFFALRMSFIVLLWLFVISLIIITVNLILRRDISVVTDYSNNLLQYNSLITKSDLGEQTKRLENQYTFLLELHEEDIVWSQMLLEIFSVLPEGIVIRSIDADTENKVISLSGIASQRDIILAWKTSLKSFEFIESVNIPLYQFTEKTDIPFSLTLTLQ